MLSILIAPSGFKESLSAEAVAEAIAEGVRRVFPTARVLLAPVIDGGEGTTEALVRASGGTLHPVQVMGPLGDPVPAFVGLLGGVGPKTAVIEIAAAAGLRLVPRNRRDPTRTTSYGVGQLLRAALDLGAETILVGCGDSGVNDGGAGMAQALGVRLRNRRGEELPLGGSALVDLAHIDLTGRDPRLERVRIEAAVNWHNHLLGPRGVARVFGPQKGASPEQVELLERAMEQLARVIRDQLGLDVASLPGSGASGGLGAGLVAFAGATLHPRYELLLRYLDLDRLIDEADLVITAEGALDEQTPFGKVPCEVGRRAAAKGKPVIALAGTLGTGAEATLAHGISAFTSVVRGPCSLDDAIARAAELVRDAAEAALRMVEVGRKLAARASMPRAA